MYPQVAFLSIIDLTALMKDIAHFWSFLSPDTFNHAIKSIL
jgi:hypothetical protein